MLEASAPTSPIHNVRYEIPPDQKASRLEQAAKKIETYQKASLEAAEALAEILEDELWTVVADSFADYVRTAFGYRRRRAYQLAKAGRCYGDLKGKGVETLPVSEAQIRPLTTLANTADQLAAWKRAVAGLEVDEITKEDVRRLTLADVDRAVAEIEGRLREHKNASAPPAHGALSQRDRDYAAIEDEMAVGNCEPPSPALHAEHYGTLGRLDPADQAQVWVRVANAMKSGGVMKDGVLEAGPMAKHTKQRTAVIDDAIVALAKELGGSEADAGAPTRPRSAADTFRVLIARDLLAPATASSLSSADEVGGSPVVDYGGAEKAVEEAVKALDDETDAHFHEKMQAGRTKEYGVQRSLARTRLEPEIAAWAWHVLIPDPRRTPTTWIPDADAPASCYVPARLSQPENTDRGSLVVTRGDEPAYDLRIDHAVLLAPGVDLLGRSVPNGVLDEILQRAKRAEDFVFLAATRQYQRLGKVAWPKNVRPVVPVASVEELEDAIAAFKAAGCKGGLYLDNYDEGISPAQKQRVKKHAMAAIVRGAETSQGAYDALVSLRGPSFGVLVGEDVPHRPRDTPFGDPATLPNPEPRAPLPGTPGSGLSGVSG